MRIHLHCPINPTGVGTHAQYLVNELCKLEAEVGPENISVEVFPRGTVMYSTRKDVSERVAKKLVTQRSINPDLIVILDVPQVCVRTASQIPPGPRVVAYTVFEQPFEDNPLDGPRPFAEAWTPSDWGSNHLARWLPTKVVPEGVEALRQCPIKKERRSKDIPSIISIGKFERRKGQDILLDILPDWHEHIRLYAFWDNPWAPKKCFDYLTANGWKLDYGYQETGIGGQPWVKGKAVVLLKDRKPDQDAVFEVARACDMAVFPHRGEGWGLPILECIAMGLPTAATLSTGAHGYLSTYRQQMLDELLGDPVMEPHVTERAWDPPFFTGDFNWSGPVREDVEQRIKNWTQPDRDGVGDNEAVQAVLNEIGWRMAGTYSWSRSALAFCKAAAECIESRGWPINGVR